ncbi:uncharacterized protein LOC142576396 isoform X2 [Dermacentor variabilis]|uniref:uncharacterized protein LOC142576396 isoform X2 n=1 Tax=Dermacentor variabilis TaxID=34621 RepID=UPI003F5C7B94
MDLCTFRRMMGNSEAAKSMDCAPVSFRKPNLDNAWCVPLLASISTFLLTMPFTCFGLLFVIIVEKFGTTREETSWIESVFIMCSNLSALAIAFLQLRYTLSHIALMAAVLTSTAVIASAFAPNVVWMSIIFGGFYGFFRDSEGSYDNFYRMLGGINFFVMVQFAIFLVCTKKKNNATVKAVICTTGTITHEEKASPPPPMTSFKSSLAVGLEGHFRNKIGSLST